MDYWKDLDVIIYDSWRDFLEKNAEFLDVPEIMMSEAGAHKKARLNREWQEHMSSTAYQRSMQDLKKAGLNPILAYTQGGASTPAGGGTSSAMGTAYTDNFNYGYGSSNNSSHESGGGGSTEWSKGYSSTTDNLRNQLENLAVVSGVQSDALLNMIMLNTGTSENNTAWRLFKSGKAK